VAEVIGHGQALDAPPVGQAVADEVHAPHLVDALGDVQGVRSITGRLAFLRLRTARLAAL
jgi:hypothetical protein